MSDYQQYFGLTAPLFGSAEAPFFLECDQHRDLLAAVRRGFSEPATLITLAGATGAGKTAFIRHALDKLGIRARVVSVGRMRLKQDEVLDLILSELGESTDSTSTIVRLGLLRDALRAVRDGGERVVVLVEDAERAGGKTLSELDILCGGEGSFDIDLIVCGGPALSRWFDDEGLDRFKQRASARLRLEPFAADEVERLLGDATMASGADAAQLFDSEFAALLHIASSGSPRLAKKLTLASLVTGAEREQQPVTGTLLADVARRQFDIDVPVPEPAPEPLSPPTEDAATESAAEPPLDAPANDDDADEDIPYLIQDTQPELTALRMPPEEPKLEPPDDPGMLPDLDELTAEIAAASQLVEALPVEESELPDPARLTGEAKAESPDSNTPTLEPEAVERPEPATLELEPDNGAPEQPGETGSEPEFKEPVIEVESGIIDTRTDINLDVPELTVSAAAQPKRDTAPAAQKAVEPPSDADRDPTLAELKPDLEALELALVEDTVEEAPEPEPKAEPEAKADGPKAPADVPEITLDNSIDEKVAAETEELRRKQAEAAAREAQNKEAADKPKPVASEDARKPGPSDTEVEKMVADLSRMSSLEDMDDRMAETLFGEEINLVASQVLRRAHETLEKNDTGAGSNPPAQNPAAGGAAPNTAKPPADAGADAARKKEFEKVWGSAPDGTESISLDSSAPPAGGLDTSASQRLATVRALNAGLPKPPPPAQRAAPQKPVPIEDQIDISMTATFEALKIDPDKLDQDADDAEEKPKKGLFSRFRKKG